MFYVVLNQRTPADKTGLHTSTRAQSSVSCFFFCGSLMDSECTAANVQPLVDDGTAPSAAVSQTARRRRASESTEARERRLERERARRRQRLASETAEERERRLSQRRARDRARRAVRASSTSAEERLSQRRARDRARRAARSSPASETRLEQWRSAERRRRATESPAERATRLQDLSTRQQERITSETPEETAARRQRDREAHTHRPPPVTARSLLHQPGVHARMRRFHSQLASLEVCTCTTCLERFPGMTTRQTAAGTECIRCHRDTHSPKAYSWENNMHPGPVPMELEVGVVCLT